MSGNELAPKPDHRVQTATRQAKALALRMEGRKYEEIAQELGYSSKSGAYLAVQAALKDLPNPGAEEARRVQFARLEAIVERHWENMGDPQVAYLLVKIMERQAALMGLDVKKPEGGMVNYIKVYKGIDIDAV